MLHFAINVKYLLQRVGWQRTLPQVLTQVVSLDFHGYLPITGSLREGSHTTRPN
jgi:hypothetical protein